MHRIIHFIVVISFLSICAFSLHSCKDDDQGNGNCALQVEALLPLEEQVYASGEQIPLNIEFSACSPIQSYLVSVRNKKTNRLVFILSEFANESIIEVDTSVILEVNELSEMDIEVRAEDSEGNQIEEVAQSFDLTPPRGNVMNLRFNLFYEGERLLMNQDYTYPTGETFEFSRFDMYMSDLSLQNIDGSEILLSDLDYLIMTDAYRDVDSAQEGFVYKTAGIPAGNFESVKFNIGIPPDLNETTPSSYPVSHPLGRAGDYWSGWESYIFASIEGRINVDVSNPDLEQGIALHLGSNNAFQSIELEEAFTFSDEEGESQVINIDVNLEDLFINENGDIYDIVTVPQTHSLIHIPQVMVLSNNLKNSINK